MDVCFCAYVVVGNGNEKERYMQGVFRMFMEKYRCYLLTLSSMNFFGNNSYGKLTGHYLYLILIATMPVYYLSCIHNVMRQGTNIQNNLTNQKMISETAKGMILYSLLPKFWLWLCLNLMDRTNRMSEMSLSYLVSQGSCQQSPPCN